MDIQAAPSKRNQRARIGSPGRQVRRALWRAHDSRGNRWPRPEQLGMDTASSDAPGRQAGGQITHEGGWPTDEEIGIPGYFQFPQHPNIQAPSSVEIHTWPILGAGRAVAYVTAAPGHRLEKASNFLGERMFPAIAGSTQPPD